MFQHNVSKLSISRAVQNVYGLTWEYSHIISCTFYDSIKQERIEYKTETDLSHIRIPTVTVSMTTQGRIIRSTSKLGSYEIVHCIYVC